jgi:ribosomal protein L37AE/L43A
MECRICNQNTLREEEEDIFYCCNCGDSFYFNSYNVLTVYPGRMTEDVKKIVRDLYFLQERLIQDYFDLV